MGSVEIAAQEKKDSPRTGLDNLYHGIDTASLPMHKVAAKCLSLGLIHVYNNLHRSWIKTSNDQHIRY